MSPLSDMKLQPDLHSITRFRLLSDLHISIFEILFRNFKMFEIGIIFTNVSCGLDQGSRQPFEVRVF